MGTKTATQCKNYFANYRDRLPGQEKLPPREASGKADPKSGAKREASAAGLGQGEAGKAAKAAKGQSKKAKAEAAKAAAAAELLAAAEAQTKARLAAAAAE